MTAISRTAQFAKVHKVLKKHYKSSPCNAGRTVVEHLLFACCLEDAHHDAAEEAFAGLVHTFFDWNEVRVTSISELSEVMACLPDPRAAANRVKRVLHAVFEATFNFDLEDLPEEEPRPHGEVVGEAGWDDPLHRGLRRPNGAGRTRHPHRLRHDGRAAAAGPGDRQGRGRRRVPGLERAMAKSKGIEFGSLLHELGADFSANAYSPQLREILLQIDPACESRLPKRRVDRAARNRSSRRAAGESRPRKPSRRAAAERPKASRSRPSRRKTAARKKPASTQTAVRAAEEENRRPQEPPTKPASAEKALPRTAAPRSGRPRKDSRSGSRGECK